MVGFHVYFLILDLCSRHVGENLEAAQRSFKRRTYEIRLGRLWLCKTGGGSDVLGGRGCSAKGGASIGAPGPAPGARRPAARLTRWRTLLSHPRILESLPVE